MLDIGFVVQNAVRHDGQGRAALEAVRSAAARGHRVTVYAHALDDGVEPGVGFVPIARRPGPQAVDDLAMLKGGGAAVDRGNHDVACIVGPTALPACPTVFYAHFSYRGWRQTWTATTRPNAFHRLHGNVAERLERRCATHAHRIVAPSLGVARDVAADSGTPFDVVPNGIDLDEFPPVEATERRAARRRFDVRDDVFTFAFVGDHATPRKGLASLLGGLAHSGLAARLLVAGKGDGAGFATLTEELGIHDRVTFLGFEPARPVIAAADAVVVPSHYEPFSLVALEAAASGVPLVMSARAGASPVLEGTAIAIGDPTDEQQVAAALSEARGLTPGDRTSLLERARERVAGLRWPDVAGRVVDNLEAVAGAPREVRRGA